MSPGEPGKSPSTPRALARERTMHRIVELGNAQLAEHGPAELSVREVARGLGMVSSAIYRYVRSRDELLTLLIVDAYEDLADTVEDAVAWSRDSPRERFLALGAAMTRWALEHPERWTLLYGTPVRGYDAPADTTIAPGIRVIGHVLTLAADAAATGDGPSSVADLAPTPAVTALLEENLPEFDVDTDPVTAMRALAVWSSLVGIISAHVFGQLGPDAVAVGEDLLAGQLPLLADLITAR